MVYIYENLESLTKKRFGKLTRTDTDKSKDLNELQQIKNLDRVNAQNATLYLDEYVRKQMVFFTKHIDRLNDDKMKQIAQEEQLKHLTS